MNATDFLERSFLNAVRGESLTAPAGVYLGLFLTSPNEEGKGTEVAYSGYSRQKIQFSEPTPAKNSVEIQSTAQMTFPKAITAGGTAQHVGIFDSLTGGNCLAYGALTESITIGIGESPVVLAGDIKLSLSGQLSIEYKKKLLNVFRGTTISGIQAHMALWNENPESGGSELSGGEYARVAVNFSPPEPSDSGQMIMEAAAGVTFPRPTAEWGQWKYTTLQDSSAGGQPIYISQEATPTVIKKGYRPTFDASDIRVAIN